MVQPVDTAAPARGAGSPSQEVARPSGAIKIDVEQMAFSEAPPARRYWVGVRTSAPFDNVTKGGITFLKFKGVLPMSDAGRIDLALPHERGDVVEITDQQLALVKKRVANMVIRTGRATEVRKDAIGNNVAVERTIVAGRVTLDSVVHVGPEKGRTVNYRPEERDVPLGHYLYMVPVYERMPTNWRTEEPEPMCDADSMIAGPKKG